MANMTRDNMVTELQSRGWGRFLAADLQRYLDWALQDMYSKAGFRRDNVTPFTVAASTADVLTFATISAAAADNIREVLSVYVKYNGVLYQVEAATPETFSSLVWPNTQGVTKDQASVPEYYYVYDEQVFLYPTPTQAVDYIIHCVVRDDVFTSGTDVTDLPQRFDKGVLMLAESHCFRRARDYEGLGVCQAIFDKWLLDELAVQGQVMAQDSPRVTAYGH